MSKHYYRVCPDCGCNLDPGERCDCKNESYPEPGSSNFDKATPDEIICEPLPGCDTLLIGYDISNGLDLACLSVARKSGKSGIDIEKVFYGLEAMKMYELLTQGPCIRYDPQMPEFMKKEFHVPCEERGQRATFVDPNTGTKTILKRR